MKFCPVNILFIMFLLLLTSCSSSAQDAGFTDVNPGGLSQFLETNNAVIIDVRTPGEWDAGKVASAVTIDLRHRGFNDAIAELDRDATYLVYCNSGNRSRIASARMANMGFKNIYNYDGSHFQIRREYEELRKDRSR
ncbi:MAG: rhodanese-like domain-containing protein [Balneolaceae bacterium]|nr:MAG: rhodanese-like domain-containing protein [Balneolaceae bacterium]